MEDAQSVLVLPEPAEVVNNVRALKRAILRIQKVSVFVIVKTADAIYVKDFVFAKLTPNPI